MYLGYFHPSESHAVHPYSQLQPLFHYNYPGQNPMSPMDLSYSQSMLPANLFSAAPSPYGPRQSYFQLQPSLPLYHPRMQSGYNSLSYHKSSTPSGLPYLTHSTSNTSLDQLNLSRTVIMRNLSSDLSLNDLLSEIDYGPIEYLKMFESQAPTHFSDVQTLKTCFISFVNTQILVSFHSKYGKNTYNLRSLKERLKNSKYLKITLNEPNNPANGLASNNLSKQDFIKLKTLNYINEFNATRAVKVLFTVADPALKATLKDDFQSRCSKYGEVEDFQTVADDENNHKVSFVLHFTSIDAAIKIYEYHLKRTQIDYVNLMDLVEPDVLPTMCTGVTFHKDRCDRTELKKTRRPAPNGSASRIVSSSSSSSVPSSPTSGRKPMLHHFQSAENCSFVSHPTARSLESSSIPLHSTSIREEEGGEEITSTRSADHNKPTETGKEESILPCPPHALSPLTEPKSNVESSSSGAIHSSLAPSENTDVSRSRGRRFQSNASDPYLFASHSALSQSNISNMAASIGLPNGYHYNPDPFNVGNRTLYLGNLHPNTTVEEIANNVRAGGLVESIKHHKAKKMCFITFVDAAIALKFFLNHQVLHQLIIHGNEVNVSWGKNHSGQLSREIALAVTAGASRNVYIGKGCGKDEENIELPDEKTLREDFGRFGEMEQINFYNNKDCGFINFTNISAAIKVVEMFENRDPKLAATVAIDIGELYEKYKNFKISFGKDRCGNSPKFSFKKRDNSYEFLRDRDLVDMPAPREEVIRSDKEVGPINNEAAMVFGIRTEPVDSDKPSSPAEYLAESTVLEGEDTDRKEEAESADGNTNDVPLKLFIEDVAKALDVATNDETRKQGTGNEEENEDDGDDVADEDDVVDEDDISIIIGSDVTNDPPHKKSHKKYQRLYHHHSYLNDGMNSNWGFSRNSSALSLNSSYAKHYNYHPASFSPAPPVPQPVMYQQSPQFMPQMRTPSYYGVPQMAPVPQPQLYHHNSFPAPNLGSLKGPYTMSGSQVMAQYLAKSQHENYLYASSILNNDVTLEEIREYNKSSRRPTRTHQV